MNEETIVDFNSPPNFGVLTCNLPKSVLNPLRDYLNKIENENFSKSVPNNKNLLGHMEKEYKMDDMIEFLQPFLLQMGQAYEDQYQYYQTFGSHVGSYKLALTELWVNYQKKHEFNPPHLHTGVLSFVIWIKIPYKLQDEDAIFPTVNSGGPRTGKFTFHYVNILGQFCSLVLPVDSTWEGRLALFPSLLTHSVNPFYTSDEYRISISGNLRFVNGE
jgi:hypothetical protein